MKKIDMSADATGRRLEVLRQISHAAVALGRIGKATGLGGPLNSEERSLLDRSLATRRAVTEVRHDPSEDVTDEPVQ